MTLVVNDMINKTNLQLGHVNITRRMPEIVGQIGVSKVSPYKNIIQTSNIFYVEGQAFGLIAGKHIWLFNSTTMKILPT